MSEPRLTNLKQYLQRLGFEAPPPPTLETLRELHGAIPARSPLKISQRSPAPRY